MELHKIDFNKYWLAADPYGELVAVERDSTIVRWVKYLIQILTCGCSELYEHIRIDRVTQALMIKFQNTADNQKRSEFLAVVENLTYLKHPIHTYRSSLFDVHAKMLQGMGATVEDKIKNNPQEINPSPPASDPKAKRRLKFPENPE